MLTVPTDGLLVTSTALVEDRFGWTMYGAMVQKQIWKTVDTTDGAVTTVDTTKMYLSRVLPVL